MSLEITESTSPLIKQYLEIKNQFQDAFVFFQVGDFYELFFDDAVQVSHILGITLTKRGTYQGQDIPLCGVPVHTATHYYLKLIAQGHKVILCEQTEQAQVGKLVNRAVSQILTPGTIVNEQGLDEKKTSFITFISFNDNTIQLAVVEFITQQLLIIPIDYEKSWQIILSTELEKITPAEIIIDDTLDFKVIHFLHINGYKTASSSHQAPDNKLNEWMKEKNIANSYYQVLSLTLGYLNKYFSQAVAHLNCIIEKSDHYMWIDSISQKHLELTTNNFDGSSMGTLYQVLDHTSTAMGSRLLCQWIIRPLKKYNFIFERHQAIKSCINNWHIIPELKDDLKKIGDFERVIGRVRLKRALYTDYQRITKSLEALKTFKTKIIAICNQSKLLSEHEKNLGSYEFLSQILENYIYTQTPPAENLVKTESDEQLVYFDQCIKSAAQILLKYEEQEQIKNNLPSLKIKKTPLYGYVLEINKTNSEKLPQEYIRVQTLANKERYTHPELKKIEFDIIHAQEAYKKRDTELFNTVAELVYKESQSLFDSAKSIANFDALISLATAAQKFNYIQPEIDINSSQCIIKNGRHPVIAAKIGHSFIPNSLSLHSAVKTWIITGPNMGGKSTFMRQSALICIMAQIGSWVPAEYAKLPLLDSLFTRIGASDNVIKGKSTFYVEMEETATICALASEKSMVILDEIGRGTSTYDGMSIAYAIIKYINEVKKPFLLCSTHYHELSELFKNNNDIEWHHAAIAKEPLTEEIIHLHTIKKGTVHTSLGIEVAKKVGLPSEIINLAKEVKNHLESTNLKIVPAHEIKECQGCNSSKKLQDYINQISLDEISPRQAYEILEKLKKYYYKSY